MQFQVEVGARLRKVTVERDGDLFRVGVDGRMRLVDVRRIDGRTLSLLLQPGDSGGAPRSLEAALVAGLKAGAFDVHVAGRCVPIHISNGSRSRRAREAAAGSGPQRIVAPMPGKVVRVLVSPGDAVVARQGLVVVEAMKMENELKAARDGTVAAVSVVEGQSVEAGAALVIVE